MKLSKHFSVRAFGPYHDRPADFYLSSWQSSESPTPMLIFRMFLAALSVAILVWSVTNAPNNYWLIYLTNWGLVIVTAMTVCGFTVSLGAKCGCVKGYRETPCYLRMYWVLYNIAVPIAFLITILYWVLIYEYDEGRIPADLWLDIMTHAVNSGIVLAEVLVSRSPSKIQHFYWPFSVGLWYLAFSGIYYAAGGTDAQGNSYIYSVLDWSDAGPTGAIVGVAAAALIGLHAFVCLIALLRRSVSKCCQYTSHDLPSAPPPEERIPEARIV